MQVTENLIQAHCVLLGLEKSPRPEGLQNSFMNVQFGEQSLSFLCGFLRPYLS